MAIRLYSGIMGAGKTYRVVYELVYGDLLQKYFVFHNLEQLKIDNKYLKEYGKDSEFNPPDLFTYKFQEQLSKQIREEYGRNILWIIEECDKIGFDKSRPDVKEWLSMHRHLGQEIYLISQSKWNIAKEYMNLLEVEIQGKRGFVFDSFIYSWFSGGEKISTDRIPKKKEIYEKYKSFHIPELKRKKSKIWLFALLFFMITISGLIYFFFFGVPKKFNDLNKVVNQTKKEKDRAIQEYKNINNSDPAQENQVEQNEFYYAGTIGKNKFLVADQNGNIYDMKLLYDYISGEENRENRKLIFLDRQKFYTLQPSFIKRKLARVGAGREARPEQEQEQETVFREQYISIY